MIEKYSVVTNQEDQYSISPLSKPMPSGWDVVGFEGGKKKCLGYIQQCWTGTRPKSVRT